MSSVTKKRRTVDVDWVAGLFQRIPDECIKKTPELQNYVEQWGKFKAAVPFPSVAAGSLSRGEVFEIFNLHFKTDTTYEFDKKELFVVPAELESYFAQYQSVVGNVSSPNEALSRCFINLIIFQCLLDERRAMSSVRPKPSSSDATVSPVTPIKSSSSGIALEAGVSQADLSLFVEVELRQEVFYKGRQHLLTGVADYSLGYGNTHTMSGNLVIVETKRIERMNSAYGQLLSYMGMIHRSRRKENKDNSIIFGAATDGIYYHFWRIDNDANVTESSIYNWNKPPERRHIYSIFRIIFRAAILSSPTTSPIKGTDFLTSYSSNHPKLDFGMSSRFQQLFVTDEDDPDIEIVDMEAK